MKQRQLRHWKLSLLPASREKERLEVENEEVVICV